MDSKAFYLLVQMYNFSFYRITRACSPCGPSILSEAHVPLVVAFKLFLLLRLLFIFRPRRRAGEREGEKHQCVVASRAPPTGDLACRPGMCPGPLALRLVLNPLSHTSHGAFKHFYPSGTNITVLLSHRVT